MWVLTAALTLGLLYVGCFAFVRTIRRRPAGLAAALALPLTVSVEACLLHALSPFHAVDRVGLLVASLAAAAALGAWVASRPRRPRWPRRSLQQLTPAGFLLLALAPVILFSALAYPPNNWDSMTYHLARVAHWIENRSVAAYPTAIGRQLVYPPGAEYLLLVLQAIAGSDRLAALVQFGAWATIVLSAPALARTFGLPRRFAPWTALVAAGGAGAVLQASSTQNDLLAGAIAVGLVAGCTPFLHRNRRRWRAPDLALLGIAVAAGALVKGTSVLCASPFLACAAWRVLRALPEREGRSEVLLAMPAVAVAALMILPAASAAGHVTHTAGLFQPFVYQGVADPGDRLLNSLRGLLRNLPAPGAAFDRLAPAHTIGCPREHSLCLVFNAAPLEDVAACVGPAIFLAIALAAGALRARKLPGRARLGIGAWLLAWVLFHATFRDNVWITRLQLPLFALAPLALGALARPKPSRLGTVLCGVVAAGLGAHAIATAVLNMKRPLNPVGDLATAASLTPDAFFRELRQAFSDEAYYRLGPPGLGPTHAAVLRELDGSGCRRLALFLGGDSWEYPLTWRAMQQGVEVRHLVGPSDPWPCAIFSDRGEPPLVAAVRTRWTNPPDLPSLYLALEPGRPASSPDPR